MQNRIGIGVYGYRDTFDTLVALHPRTVLLMDPPLDYYVRLRKEIPDCFIVLRHWRDQNNQPLDNSEKFADECVSLAERLCEVARIAGVPEARCRVDAITTYNETPHDRFEEYDSWMVDFAAIVNVRHKYPVIWGNQGVGCFQVAQVYNPFNPLNDQFVASDSRPWYQYYGGHLYSAVNEPIDGNSHSWFATRFNFTNESHIKAYGKPMLPILSTESGTNTPWRDLYSDDEYFRQLKWLQGELDKVGGRQCVFGLFDSSDNNWRGFNLMGSKIVQLIGGYNRGIV